VQVKTLGHSNSRITKRIIKCEIFDTSGIQGFGISGNLDDKEPGHSGVKIPKSRNATVPWHEFRDFGTSGVGK
jgi:hypothetical protein